MSVLEWQARAAMVCEQEEMEKWLRRWEGIEVAAVNLRLLFKVICNFPSLTRHHVVLLYGQPKLAGGKFHS